MTRHVTNIERCSTHILQCFVLFLASQIISPVQATQYTIRDLGLLPGGTFSTANAISDNGLIAGASTRDGELVYPHSVLWSGDAIIDLTGLGISGSEGHGINCAGVVVGFTDELSLNAYRWQSGRLLNLNPFPNTFSIANDVCESGAIAGYLTFAHHRSPFIWRDGVFEFLPSLTGMNVGFASAQAINAAEHVAGESSTASGFSHAFYWDGQTIRDLGTLGGNTSYAEDLNDLNHVVGSGLNAAGHTRAWIWRDGVMTELGTLGGLFSGAYAINNREQIVGYSYLQGTAVTIRAMMYEDGQMKDLNSLLPPASGWVLFEALDINNYGAIVGSGIYKGQRRAFLMTPVNRAGDVNGDESVDIQDLVSVITFWGTCGPIAGLCYADLNASGHVDIDDLVLVISNWSPAD